MGRPKTGRAGTVLVYVILKAKMTSQLSSKIIANGRTCTFTEVRGDTGADQGFFNGGWLIPIGHQPLYVNLFQVVLGLSQNMVIKEL